MSDRAQLEELNSKLDRILAEHASGNKRITSVELVLSQVVTAVNGLTKPLATLTEAIRKLGEAADKGGDGKLTIALQGIQDEMGKQTGHLAVISVGLERIPAIMEETAVNAAELATGGGANARPVVEARRPE